VTDVELTRALERCEIPNEGFPHAFHLRVAWVYLSEHETVEAATEQMAATLRRFSASVGKAEKYDHPITVFWMRTLAVARAAHPDKTLDEVLRVEPQLLDKQLYQVG